MPGKMLCMGPPSCTLGLDCSGDSRWPAVAKDRGNPTGMLTRVHPAATGRTSSRSQSLRSTDARRREEFGDELQQFGFPSPQTGELAGWVGLAHT